MPVVPAPSISPAGTRFIEGEPIKRATKTLFGRGLELFRRSDLLVTVVTFSQPGRRTERGLGFHVSLAPHAGVGARPSVRARTLIPPGKLYLFDAETEQALPSK
jgi:hypothetical protein